MYIYIRTRAYTHTRAHNTQAYRWFFTCRWKFHAAYIGPRETFVPLGASWPSGNERKVGREAIPREA